MGTSIYNTPERDDILTRAMIHRGAYDSSGSTGYQTGDVVVDGLWVMCANKDTFERPAPQPNGDPSWSIPSTLFAINNDVSIVVSGHTYTFSTGGWIKSLRVYIPQVASDISYRVLLIRGPNTANPITNIVEIDNVTSNQWNTLGFGNYMVADGEQIAVLLEHVNSSGTTQITGQWDYNGTSNNGLPADQGWNRRSQNDELRIDFNDKTASDRQAELLSIVQGSTIRFEENGATFRYQEFSVIGAPAINGTCVEYPVTLIDSGDPIPTLATCDMTATINTPQPTEFAEDVGEWSGGIPAWASAVTGELFFDSVEQAGRDNDAFGVDINFQAGLVSADWELVSFNG